MRRVHIITVAEQAFAREGYGATSMSAIAALLGGSKATLYKYFPTKAQLFEAVVERRCHGVLTPLYDLRGSTEDDLELLLAKFGTRFLTQIYEPAALDVYRLIHSEGVRFPTIVRAFYHAGPDAVIEELREMLERNAARGLIVTDLRLAAEQFLGMLRGDRFLRHATGVLPAPEADEIYRHARQAASIFLHGLVRDAQPRQRSASRSTKRT